MKRLVLTSVLLFSVLALLTTFFAAGSAFATMYYVATNGSDSNNGTSETTPWAHLPGMATWTGSHTPAAGDIFILRGCDDWPNASFPITWNWSGTSSSPITIDRDTAWYNTANCPTTWNRAVFDAGNAVMGGASCQPGRNMFVNFNGSWVTMKWIEAKGLFWNDDSQNKCFKSDGFFDASSVDYVTVDSWYVHHWSADTSKATDPDQLIFVNNSPECPHCLLTNSVFDNSDATSGSGTFFGGSVAFVNVKNNVIHELDNAIKPFFAGEISGNNIYHVGASFDPAVHENCIETIGAEGNGGVYYIHDNRIHDNYSCEGLQVGNPGETDYVWNNIWYNPLGVGANGPQVPQTETPVAMYFWNNTVVDWSDCINDATHGYTWSGPFYSQNNLCINVSGSNSSGSPAASPVTISNNLGLTDSQAATAGYTNSQTLTYSPTSNSSRTVGLGTNLTLLWPAGISTQDSSVVCTQQTVNTVVQVVCSGTPNPRPAIGAWDVGAYQYSASSATRPNPPTGLTATVK